MSLVGIKACRIDLVRQKNRAGVVDDVLKHRQSLRRPPGLHQRLGQQAAGAPVGGSGLVRVVAIQQARGLFKCLNDELPRVGHARALRLHLRYIRRSLADYRESEAVGLAFKLEEYLSMPVSKRAVEERLTLKIIESGNFGLRRRRAVGLAGVISAVGILYPAHDVSISLFEFCIRRPCAVDKKFRAVVIVAEDIVRLVKKIDYLRIPQMGVKSQSVAPGIGRVEKEVDVLEIRREIGVVDRRLVLDFEKVGARSAHGRSGGYQCGGNEFIDAVFHVWSR